MSRIIKIGGFFQITSEGAIISWPRTSDNLVVDGSPSHLRRVPFFDGGNGGWWYVTTEVDAEEPWVEEVSRL